ncbi:putative MFS multidrug transporter [Fonsecaea pedrosoi]|nr:putative MFS multidrug transporter [Fonsecaea pedrosoi]
MVFIYTYRKIRAYRARKTLEAQRQNQTSTTPSSSDGSAIQPTNLKSPSNDPKKKRPCPQCAQEKSKARKYRWKLLFCLLPAFFVASLDLTIVATALPQIASHFDKFNQLNWIVTAFTLTSTAFIPVFGQLADTFGRHATLQFAVIILTIGSVLCAAAPNWAVLLLGRALQGIGTAGVSNVSMIVLADSVSLKEQAINTSIFQLLNGVGYSIGPVIGGYLTNTDWRYCFVLGAGIAVISIVTLFILRNDLRKGKVSISRPSPNTSRLQALAGGLSTLDFGGIILFIFGVGLIILGTAWGGSTYPWSSSAVLAPLIIGAVLIVLFVFYELLISSPTSLLSRHLPKGTVPMIPSIILSSKDVGLVCFIASGTGAALYSVFYFIGIYFTLVEGYEASHAGTQLLYYVPGIGVGVYLAIFICNVYPRQTFPPLLIGTIVETAGIAVLAYAVKVKHETLVNVMMGIAGAGTGMRFMPSNLHLAGMFRDRLAPVYSLLRFALPFGGTLALTIMGSVFQNQMSLYFGSNAVNSGNNNGTDSTGGFNLHNQASLDLVKSLPPEEQQAIRSQGATATMWAFISILPILGLSLVAGLFLGNVWISKKKNDNKKNKNNVASGDSGDAEKAQGESIQGTEDVREDGLCHEHAAAAAIAATSIADGSQAQVVQAAQKEKQKEAQKNEVEYLREVYLLALLRGDVRRLKRKGASEEADVAGPSIIIAATDTGGRK